VTHRPRLSRMEITVVTKPRVATLTDGSSYLTAVTRSCSRPLDRHEGAQFLAEFGQKNSSASVAARLYVPIGGGIGNEEHASGGGA
jgi:hypothetical protein